MRQKLIIISASLLALIFLIGLHCANPQKPNSSNTLLSDSDKAIITAAYDSIAKSADSLVMLDSSIVLLSKMVPVYSKIPGIDSVWICDNAMYVLFAKGGIMSWENIRSPADSAAQKRMTHSAFYNAIALTSTIPNRNACIMTGPCLPDGDVVNANNLNSILLQNCFSSAIIPPDKFTVSFIKNNLSSYNLIFINTHGGYNGISTMLQTGDSIKNGLIDYVYNNESDWQGKKSRLLVSSMATDCSDDPNEKKPSHYVLITDSFFSYYFPGQNGKKLGSSIIYSCSCDFLENISQMGLALTTAGAKVVLGWNNDSYDHLAIATNWFQQMLNMQTVSQSISNLGSASSATITDHGTTVTSNLTCWPAPNFSTMDISGVWSGSETLTMSQSGGCGANQVTVSGTGSCVITQDGKTLTVYYPDSGITRTGTITSSNQITIEGNLIVVPATGVTMQKNTWVGKGTIVNGILQITSEGEAEGVSGGVTCDLYETSTGALTRSSSCTNSAATALSKKSQFHLSGGPTGFVTGSIPATMAFFWK